MPTSVWTANDPTTAAHTAAGPEPDRAAAASTMVSSSAGATTSGFQKVWKKSMPSASAAVPITATDQRAGHSPANRRTTTTAITRQAPLISRLPAISERGSPPDTRYQGASR